jgi:GR25 family glycosyltransferase involved in LPS biosynthesis
VDGKFLYETPRGSRCTHAYLISKKCAEKMLEFIKTSNYPVDFMFNTAIEDYGFENYWMEPDLIDQNPKWDSTIQNDIDFV